MSIITLRSTEDFGGTSASSAAAVNFQNFFKDPIYFNKDDQVSVTSVTINQEVTEIVITDQNNQLEYMLLPAMRNTGDTPFFQRHSVFITPGSYTPVSLATEVQSQLNNSIALRVYNFAFTYDPTTTPPTFNAVYKQTKAPTAYNTSLQPATLGGKATQLSNALNFAEIPFVPVSAGVNNTYSVRFDQLNQSLNTPFITEQVTGLKKGNYNKQMVGVNPLTGTNLFKACNFEYIFNKGIYANAGQSRLTVAPSFMLVAAQLKVNTQAGQDFVQIDNASGPSTPSQIYEVSAPGTSSQVVQYDYELQKIDDYVGKPLTVGLYQNALAPPTAGITGINNSANNTITTAGAGYVAGVLYHVNSVSSTKFAVINVLSLAAGGGVATFEVVFPGDGFSVGDVCDINAGFAGAAGAQITIGTGGIRSDGAGTNNALGTALTVGSTYKVFFPNGLMDNPAPGTPQFPNPQFTELTSTMNTIDLQCKIDAIDATSRKVTAVSFVSIGLNKVNAGTAAEFTRLSGILTANTQDLMLQDNNGSFTAVSTTQLQINTARDAGQVALGILRFAARVDGLMGLSTTAAVGDPAGDNVVSQNIFDAGLFSAYQDLVLPVPGSTLTRARIDETANLYEISSTGDEVVNGKLIRAYNATTGALTPIPMRVTQGRASYKVGFLRNEARELHEELGQPAALDEADILLEFESLTQKRRDVTSADAINFLYLEYQIKISTYIYPTTSTTVGQGGTRNVQKTANLRALSGFNSGENDLILCSLSKLNQFSITILQPTSSMATFNYVLSSVAGQSDGIRESIFPLCPTFQLSAGLSATATQSGVLKVLQGQDYTIEGYYDDVETSVKKSVLGPGGTNRTVYESMFNPVGTGAGLGVTTTKEAFVAQSGAGSNPDCLQLPITYTFGQVLAGDIDTTNPNPQPTASAGRQQIGFTQVEPNTARIQAALGFQNVENESAATNVNVQDVTTVGTNAIDLGLPPSMVVEFPDFNIQGYSGAAQDKFKIVATIPTEEWGTSVRDGTLHYKPLFPLPIDVNLAEDREVYSMNVRLRNLNGTLAKNLKNPTTVTFYKKPREGKELERILDRALQSRSENQDQKIATGGDQFPRV